MKKKTLKGLVVGLSALLVAAAGVGAVSIITKGFTESETLKIKPKGQVVDTINFENGTRVFSEDSPNQDLLELGLNIYDSRETISLEKTKYSASSIYGIIDPNTSFNFKNEIKTLVDFDDEVYSISFTPLFNVYDLSTIEDDDYDIIKEYLEYEGEESDTTYSKQYFDTVRVYLDNLKTDILVCYEDSYKILRPSAFEYTYIDFSVNDNNCVAIAALKGESIPEQEELEITKVETVLLGEEDESLNDQIVFVNIP